MATIDAVAYVSSKLVTTIREVGLLREARHIVLSVVSKAATLASF